MGAPIHRLQALVNIALLIHRAEDLDLLGFEPGVHGYALVKAGNGEVYIVAEALVEKVMKVGGVENYEVVARRRP